MNIPKIPNNGLAKQIKEFVECCQELELEYGERAFKFAPPATDEDITAWEQKNNISIPESYKDWLRFSNGSMICWDFAVFYGLQRIVVGINVSGQLKNDLVIIGNVIGDGEFICFSSITGKIILEDHGKVEEFNTFNDFLIYLTELLDDKALSSEDEDVLLKMVKQSEEKEI